MGLFIMAGTAQAALVLSGNTAGYFQEVSVGNTVITNQPDGSMASIFTGVPITGSFKSGVVFDSQAFAGISSGDTFAIGTFTYYNGRTQIGTASDTAVLDFYLDLDVPAVGPILLTSITFGIDATVNDPEGVNPDFFTASFSQPSSVMIDGTLVSFKINDLPASIGVAEGTWMQLAEVTVTFSPIPEPSTYGLIGAAGLLGLVGYRRFRSQKALAATA